MDLHFATEKVASLKDAALRYLVIVAGILTALALNQWIEVRAHARLGAQALASIEDELRRNHDLLGKVIASQRRAIDKLMVIEARLGGDSFAVPDLGKRARSVLDDDLLEGATDQNLAALQRSAWDAAVTSQALQYIPKERAVDLARAYAALDTVTRIVEAAAFAVYTYENTVALDMFARKESQDAMRFARSVRQHRLVMEGIHAGYLALQKTLGKASGRTTAADSAALPAPASGASAAAEPAQARASRP